MGLGELLEQSYDHYLHVYHHCPRGEGVHGANNTTKATGISNKPRLTTIKGELFLSVDVSGKNGTLVGTSHPT